MAALYDTTIANNYVSNPKDLSTFNAYRGVTDFSQIGQFNQYESGYQWLFVIKMPDFMEKLATMDTNIMNIVKSFRHILEYEFRGLDGLPDITADTFEITDGINSQRMINKVTQETSVEISSSYFEKRGSAITKFSEIYLTGIKDRMSQAKTYHGLIKNGQMEPGLEHEIFTMIYIATDNTYYNIENAYLLANCQLTKAENIYNGSRDNISNKEISVSWNAFPITGLDVDKASKTLLESVTGVHVKKSGYEKGNYSTSGVAMHNVKTVGEASGAAEQDAILDSNSYKWGVMQKKDNKKYPDGINAIDTWVKAQS